MALGLYPRLLAARWNQVAPSIRRLHLENGPVRVAGLFQVCHGSSRLAKCLLRLLRLPDAGDAIPTRLVIERQGDAEILFRTFAGRPLITTERAGDCGLLAERFGFLELLFQLDVKNGALLHQQTGAALRRG